MKERTYFPSGKIESEIDICDGIISGVSRRWFENGQLQEEIPMENSKPSGISRRYFIDGSLIDASRFLHGSGWFRTFHNDGRLAGEVASFRSAPHGTMLVFDEDGCLTVDKFFLLGKAKTKNRHQKDLRTSIEKFASVSDDEIQILLPAEMVNTAPYKLSLAFDVLSWLARESDCSRRTIGECNDRSESIRYIDDILKCGVLRFLAEEVDLEDDGSASINAVYAVLPTDDKDGRHKSFDFINSMESEMGFNVTRDDGQKAVHLEIGPW